MSIEPTVVLLPGLLCDAEVWESQRSALSPLDVLIPSYGDVDSLVAMAHTVLAAVPADRFALAGHSMGGRVALEMMRIAPRRITRLALLDTGLDALEPGAAGEAERTRRMALVAMGRAQGMAAMARQWAPGMVHPDRSGGPLLETIVAMVERHSTEFHAAKIRALLDRPDAHDVFAAVRCPTLIVCGRQDAWSPLARHEAMQRELPSARLAVVEDAGHMTTMEQPAAVSTLLADWLRQDV